MTDREVIQELKMLRNDASEYIPEAVSTVEALDIAIKALEQQPETNAPNTLCKEVKDISFCSDCVSYRHCEAVHQWILRGIAQYNAELTKQTTEEVVKNWGEILRGAIDVDNTYRRMEERRVKKNEGKNKM